MAPTQHLVSTSRSPRTAATPDEALIARLLRRGGPTPAEYAATDAWFRRVHEAHQRGALDAADMEALRDRFRAHLSPASLIGRVMHTPRGYHGDFELIDRMYLGRPCADPMLRRWDEYALQQPALQAVRNRKTYFHALVAQALAHAPARPLTILNLGSGPGRDVAELASRPANGAIEVDCVDRDEHAIAHARSLCRDLPIRFLRADVLRFRPPRDYDLIWSAGLFDYFSDRLSVALMRRLGRALRPGGRLVIGNFSPRNPSRAFMETGGWYLIHRSPDRLLELATEVGLAGTSRVEQEPLGINLFLHVSPE